MLNKICQSDGVELVNVVRSDAQATLLRGIGARHVVDSSKASFMEDLIGALAETGATLAFDAIGGGRLAGQILAAMEVAANMKAKEYSRYGSSVHKQVYIYGRLDMSPTELSGNYGMAWGVGGFLLTPFLQKIGAEGAQRLRERVASELKTTFASHFRHDQPAAICAFLQRENEFSERGAVRQFGIFANDVSEPAVGAVRHSAQRKRPAGALVAACDFGAGP
jgi:hypothetical protein